MQNNKKIDFQFINNTALSNAHAIVMRWLPEGQLLGHEYKALNPTRSDSKVGSFSINLRTGKWADFATGDKGGDMISLAAYLFNLKQGEAAKHLARMLGVEK